MWWVGEFQYLNGVCTGLCGTCCVDYDWGVGVRCGEHAVGRVPKPRDAF